MLLTMNQIKHENHCGVCEVRRETGCRADVLLQAENLIWPQAFPRDERKQTQMGGKSSKSAHSC